MLYIYYIGTQLCTLVFGRDNYFYVVVINLVLVIIKK